MSTEKELLELVVTGQVIQRAKEMRLAYKQRRNRDVDTGKEVPPEKLDSDFIEEAVAELRENHRLVSGQLDWNT
ncbi:hypothetical protein [Caulobacter sp. RHG1]|uniref:hypothetical protein n=1 Tax=Caulobacter sp. (strain RHG1) TaxID=2545762 RepID=UPI0015517A40|nr:hypothetical protein [Caulobacter sp. RHG1]NQE62963.1 hypothetical protein [Caulobacter sp. RHG1]